MILPVTNGVHKDVADLYGDQFTVALAQAMTRLECAPYWHSGEKAPSRLVRAGELVRLSRVQLHDERTATVHGSTKPYDLTGFHCTCPQSEKGKSMWCVHAVAVKLARTLASASQVQASDPDDDDTLDTGVPVDDQTLPLALPPVTVDERLAQIPHVTHEDGPGEEMPPMDDPYIPEPDDAPVAVLERPTTAVTPRVETTDLERALTTWTAERAVVQRFLKQELKANIDYYTLKIGGKESKPSLSKAGAEKVMGWLKLQASFTPDTGTWEMLGRPQDLVAYVCTLRTRSGEIVGEGRGARSIKKDGGDINKAIKMAEKSSMVSAVIRTGCLSDVFTQDLDDQQDSESAPSTAPARPSSADPVSSTGQALRQRIWQLVQAADATITTREACKTYVQRMTGMTLEPDNYGAIITILAKGGR